MTFCLTVYDSVSSGNKIMCGYCIQHQHIMSEYGCINVNISI